MANNKLAIIGGSGLYVCINKIENSLKLILLGANLQMKF